MNRRQFLTGAVALGTAQLLPRPLSAQTPSGGVSPLEVRLGTSLSLTGIHGVRDYDYLRGFLSLINDTNSRGGIHHRRLSLFLRDHGDDPRRAMADTTILMRRHDIFALAAFGNTDAVVRVLPLLRRSAGVARQDLPMFGSLSGAPSLRATELQDIVTSLRPSFRDEMQRWTDLCRAEGHHKIGICHRGDAEGRSLVEALRHGMRSAEPTVEGMESDGLTPTSSSTPSIDAGGPGGGASGTTVDLVEAVMHPQMATLDLVHFFKKHQVDAMVCALPFPQAVDWLYITDGLQWRVPTVLPSTLPGEALAEELNRRGMDDAERPLFQSRTVPPLNQHPVLIHRFKNITRQDAGLKEEWRPDQAKQYPWTAAGLEGFLTAAALIRSFEAAGPELKHSTWKGPASAQMGSWIPEEPGGTSQESQDELTPELSEGIAPSDEDSMSPNSIRSASVWLTRLDDSGRWREVDSSPA